MKPVRHGDKVSVTLPGMGVVLRGVVDRRRLMGISPVNTRSRVVHGAPPRKRNRPQVRVARDECKEETEGARWCRGWDGEAVNALRAAAVLE